MKVAIATDHNGSDLKKDIIVYLNDNNYEVIDCSPINEPTDDYPDFAKTVAENVASNNADAGILMCGTGIGMSIAANKVKGIRCAKISNIDEAKLAREHNDANIAALSYHEDINTLINYIDAFLTTPFSGDERHVRRINKIKDMEN